MLGALNGWRWGRAIRYIAYLAAALIVVVAAAALLLPHVLDIPAVSSQIQGRLSRLAGSDISWEKLNVRILPSPRGVLQRARIAIPGIASVRVEEVNVRLRFWPLLKGRVEVVSASVVRPEIRIEIAPSPPPDEKKGEESAGSPDPATLYRSVMGVVAGAVRQSDPDAMLEIEDGVVDVRAPGLPPIEFRRLSVRVRNGADGMELEATTEGNHWDRLKLAARVEYADLAAKASLDIRKTKPQAWLDLYLPGSPVRVEIPGANLRAQASFDAKARLECDFDVTADTVDVLNAGERVRVAGAGLKGKVSADGREIAVGLEEARLGASRLREVKLRYEMENGALAGGAGFDLDMNQAMDATRQLVPGDARAVLAWFQPVTGRAQGNVKLDFRRSRWNIGVDIRNADVSVHVRDLPDPVRLRSGAVAVNQDGVKVERVALSMPAGEVMLSALSYPFKGGATAGSAGFDFDLGKVWGLALSLLPEESRAALADVQSVAGRAQGNAKFGVSGDQWNAGVDILKSDASIQVRQLPGPVRISGGSVQIDPNTASVDRVALSMLDAQALVSATASDYRSDRLRVVAAMPEGTVGENVLAWIWRTADLPPHLELKAPIRATAPRVTWGPERALDVQATARFDAGPQLAVELGWTPQALDLRRIAIKDGRSDLSVAVRAEGRSLDGNFSGALDVASISAMLKNPKAGAGRTRGDVRFKVDRDNPRRTAHEGKLSVEAFDLAWLLQQPVVIDRIDLESDGSKLRIGEASVNWAGQRATIRGEVKYGAGGPVIDAQLDSPGINLDALLPPGGKTAADEKPAPAADDKDAASRLWPLPVTGRITVRSDFVQRGRRTVAPVAATLVLEERRAHLDLTQAQLCGISLPLTIEATPQGVAATARITAQKQQLEQVAQCLTDQGVLITGDFDLKADISTQGRIPDLVRNLKGTVAAESRNGRVMKFALLGNILSLTNVAAVLEEGGPKLDAAGFPYRTILVSGHFEKGTFLIDASALRSDAVGLVATGRISLVDYQSQLSVLVAPFSRLDELVRKLPILGYVVGGALTSLPVGVSGDIRDPLVVPLGPKAVTSELVGIFERTLKLPGKLIAPLDGKGEAQPQDGK